MARTWVENTANGPRVIGGKFCQRGEGNWVEDGPIPQPSKDGDVTVRDGVLYGPAGQSLVSGAGKRQATAASRLVGGTSPTASQLNGTRCLKMEAEGAFDAVRLHLLHRETTAPTVFRALVAATETAALTNAAVAGQPTAGGVQTKALRAAVGSPGWAAVTFAGAASGDIQAATSRYAPSVLTSDWVELPSVPRADGGRLPLLMVRIYHDGSANAPAQQWNACGGFVADTDADKTAWENAGPRATGANARPSGWWREYQYNTITAVDGVTAPATDVPSATLQGAGMWVMVEFGYRNPALCVIGCGNSLTECTISTGGYGSWQLRGCMLASTPAKPISYCNAGLASQNSSTYIAHAEAMVPILKPTHLVYELLSPNDQAAVNALTATEATLQMARLQRMVRLAKSNSAKLVVVSPFPNNGYDAVSDGNRLTMLAAARDAAATGAFDLIDVEAVLGDGAVPVRYKAGFAYDNTHPNNAGYDALAAAFRTYLATQ